MYYTIAITREIQGKSEVWLNKAGNKYDVEFTSKEKQETTRKTFDRIDDALKVYQKYVEAFVRGDYSYEDRKSWLE